MVVKIQTWNQMAMGMVLDIQFRFNIQISSQSSATTLSKRYIKKL